MGTNNQIFPNFNSDGAPEFTGRPRIIKENNDSTIVLELDCEAEKMGDIIWLKDDMPIKNQGRYLMEFNESQPNMFCIVLEIENVDTEDAGTYVCIARNSKGEAERIIILRPEDVQKPKPKNNDVPPSFKDKPKDQVGVDGDRIVVSCKVAGIPKPEVTWYKNKQPLQKSKVKIDHKFESHFKLC